MDYLCQILIMILGGFSIWLISLNNKFSKWGFVFGLISQPFWFYTSIKHSQWGIIAISVWYTFCYCQGIYNFFFKNVGKNGINLNKTNN